MIRIDGGYGEGGGQILRTALALSCITGKPFEIYGIRRGRKNPGLQAQHLTGVRASALISGARLEGAELGSDRLVFRPGPVRGGAYVFDVAEIRGSAGSVTLVLQALLPPLIRADGPSSVSVRGGTHVEWSPPFHYMRDVLLHFLAGIGVRAALDIEKWGWYPKGGGKVVLTVEPSEEISAVRLTERGRLLGVTCISAVSNLPLTIAERQRDRGLQLIRDAGIDARADVIDAPSPGKGTFFFVLAEYENIRAGFSALGAIGKKAETVAEEATARFIGYHRTKGALDPHLADQVIPFLALSKAPSIFTTSKITRHLLTNIWVTEKFLPVKITVCGREGGLGRLEVTPL